jgi:tetratricopeptide (TPR) repeat protein
MTHYADFPLWMSLLGFALLVALALWARRQRVAGAMRSALAFQAALSSPSEATRLLAVDGLRRLVGSSSNDPLRAHVVAILGEYVAQSTNNRQARFNALEALGRLRRHRFSAPLEFSMVDFRFGIWSGPYSSGLPSGLNLGKARFQQCLFPDSVAVCDFREALFCKMTFQSVAFKHCDFRKATFEDCEFDDVSFENCLMQGIVIRRGAWENISSTENFVRDAEFAPVNLRPAASVWGRWRSRWLRGPRWAFESHAWSEGLTLSAVALLCLGFALFQVGIGPSGDILQAASHGELLTLIGAPDLLRAGDDAFETKAYDEAIRDYSEYIRLLPRSASAVAYYDLAVAQLRVNQFDQAIDNLNLSERKGYRRDKIAPPRAAAFCLLGQFAAAKPDIEFATAAKVDLGFVKSVCKTGDASP